MSNKNGLHFFLPSSELEYSYSFSSFYNDDFGKDHFESHMKCRRLLSDRKGLFDHFRLGDLFRSEDCHASQINTKSEEVKILELLYEKKCWTDIIRTLLSKTAYGILRFQCVTMTLRLYEWFLADIFVVTDRTLDRLTKDTYNSAIRKYGRLSDRNCTYDRNKVICKIFSTCLWANSLSYLADLTIQILIYFFIYHYPNKEKTLSEDHSRHYLEENRSKTSLLYSKVLKIFIYRTLSLMTACIGAAIGSSLHPGWGTLLGVQIGDSITTTFS